MLLDSVLSEISLHGRDSLILWSRANWCPCGILCFCHVAVPEAPCYKECTVLEDEHFRAKPLVVLAGTKLVLTGLCTCPPCHPMYIGITLATYNGHGRWDGEPTLSFSSYDYSYCGHWITCNRPWPTIKLRQCKGMVQNTGWGDCKTCAVDNWIMFFPNHLLLVVDLATIPYSHGHVCKSGQMYSPPLQKGRYVAAIYVHTVSEIPFISQVNWAPNISLVTARRYMTVAALSLEYTPLIRVVADHSRCSVIWTMMDNGM